MLPLRALLVMAFLSPIFTTPGSSPTPRMEFGRDLLSDWRALNDGVMGGRSIGRVEYGRSSMTWAGKISLENNGGFSSVRSPWGRHDLSAFDGVTIRCRTTTGEPDTFTMTMETSERWWMPYWKVNFEAMPEWTEVKVPFKGLKRSSAYTGELPEFWSWGSLEAILRMGFMKYDGTARTFGLEVDWIQWESPAVRN